MRNHGGGMIDQGQRVAAKTLNRAARDRRQCGKSRPGDGRHTCRSGRRKRLATLADRAQETVGNDCRQDPGNSWQRVVLSQAPADPAAGVYCRPGPVPGAAGRRSLPAALYENPLAVGAVALALGTAVGFTLPQTRRENELLGEARDTLIDRAQAVAQDTLEKVRQVAGDVVDQAQTTVQEKAKEQGLAKE